MNEYLEDHHPNAHVRSLPSTPVSNAVTIVLSGDKELGKVKRLGGEGERSWGGDGTISHINWQGVQETTYKEKDSTSSLFFLIF